MDSHVALTKGTLEEFTKVGSCQKEKIQHQRILMERERHSDERSGLGFHHYWEVSFGWRSPTHTYGKITAGNGLEESEFKSRGII